MIVKTPCYIVHACVYKHFTIIQYTCTLYMKQARQIFFVLKDLLIK